MFDCIPGKYYIMKAKEADLIYIDNNMCLASGYSLDYTQYDSMMFIPIYYTSTVAK